MLHRQSVGSILEMNLQPNYWFDVLSKSEILVSDLFKPDRVLIMSLGMKESEEACQSLAEVYANLVLLVLSFSSSHRVHILTTMWWIRQERILAVSLWSLEPSKLAANAMLMQHISSHQHPLCDL